MFKTGEYKGQPSFIQDSDSASGGSHNLLQLFKTLDGNACRQSRVAVAFNVPQINSFAYRQIDKPFQGQPFYTYNKIAKQKTPQSEEQQ
jgi:hypothetical protein